MQPADALVAGRTTLWQNTMLMAEAEGSQPRMIVHTTGAFCNTSLTEAAVHDRPVQRWYKDKNTCIDVRELVQQATHGQDHQHTVHTPEHSPRNTMMLGSTLATQSSLHTHATRTSLTEHMQRHTVTI